MKVDPAINKFGVYIHELEWAIGDTVKIDADPLHCRVTAILIRDRGTQVEVSWVNGGTPAQAWVEPWRLTLAQSETIGFRP